MRAWLKLTWIDIKLFLREPVALFFVVAFPVLLLLVFGGIYGNEPSVMFGGQGAVDVLVPGFIGLIIATSALMSLPIALATDRESGALRRFQAAPVSPLTVLAARVIVNLLVSLVGAALVFWLGWAIYGLQMPAQPLRLLFLFVLGSLSLYAVGFLIGGTVGGARGAQAVGNALLFPMIFLSGAALPQALLPDTMLTISRALPLTYIVDGLQRAWYGEAWNVGAVAILAGLLVVMGWLAVRTFRWQT